MKILFIVKKRNLSYSPYSPPFGLLYSAKFVARMLSKNGHSAEVVQAVDGNDIDRLVTNADADIVVLEALWATPAKVKELLELKRHEHRTWVVRIHSKPSFLAMEGMATKWLADFAKMSKEFPNLHLAVNNESARDDFSQALKHLFLFLPNFYVPSTTRQGFVKCGRTINIGCFGALRPLKNTYLQAIAAISYADYIGKRLNFYINSTRVEQHGEPALKNIQALFNANPRHKLVEVEWKSHEDILALIKKMDLGLQVSFSESFNIVTADFVSVGVPIVVSKEIGWMPKLFQSSTTSALKIALKLGDVNFIPRFVTRFLMRRSLAKYNNKSKALWLEFVGGFK